MKLSKNTGSFECNVCDLALMLGVLTFICWTHPVAGPSHYILFQLIFTMQLIQYYRRKWVSEQISNLLKITLKVINRTKFELRIFKFQCPCSFMQILFSGWCTVYALYYFSRDAIQISKNVWLNTDKFIFS